jgi:hypothetical protein
MAQCRSFEATFVAEDLMHVPTATAQWIIAIASVGFVSYWLRDTLAPFMMALICSPSAPLRQIG